MNIHERGRYIYGGKAEKHKKWRKTGKEKCGRNRKMTFLSHRKPENLKISAENCLLKLREPESSVEKLRKTGKQGKKLRKAGKT